MQRDMAARQKAAVERVEGQAERTEQAALQAAAARHKARLKRSSKALRDGLESSMQAATACPCQSVSPVAS